MLSTHAKERSTFVVTANFASTTGAVAPTSAYWSLTDSAGTVINSRSDVTITSPTSSEDIVLSSSDLKITTNENDEGVRTFTVEGAYNSSLGNGLPLKECTHFIIDPLIRVTS